MKRSRSRSRNKDCIGRSKLTLRKDQRQIVKFLNTHDELLVVHGTGCGKTLSAVTASQCYLDKNPRKRVVFIGPASLLTNFQKELKAYGGKKKNKYSYYSFQAFMHAHKKGRKISCKNTFLIIDEVHNLRNIKTKMYQAVIECAKEADKRMLLTATPYVNNIYDFAALINLLYGMDRVGYNFKANKVTYEYILKRGDLSKHNINIIKKLLKKKVDYLPSCATSKYYPKIIEEFHEIPITNDYAKKYELSLGKLYTNPSKYYHGYRKAVNHAGKAYYSPKIKEIIPLLKKQKSVIFTNWLKHGTEIIEKLLYQKNITFATFQGSLTKKKRKEIIAEFNNNEFDVLIITKAGGEGLDLKGVRNLIVLEPVWNDAGLRQIIGRVARYKSHEHLPKEERKVKILKLMLVSDKQVSGDKLLYHIIERKSKEQLVIAKKILRKCDISDGKSKKKSP
jgi:superfamily II DNA or RNA helicase